MELTIVTGLMAIAFCIVHLFVGRLRFLDRTPRSRWLSFAGGVAVSYVFLHVLPDLGARSAEFSRETGLRPAGAESLVYSLALIGLATFYGLERALKVSRARTRGEGEDDVPQQGVLWLHIASYATLNMLIGYLLLHREEAGGLSLGLYFVAMLLHFATADFGMRQDHPQAYDHMARWVLAAAVLAGWMLGTNVTFSPIVIGCLFAFLAGGIVLNVLKEELPEERRSFFLPFLGGTVLYALLVLLERNFA